VKVELYSFRARTRCSRAGLGLTGVASRAGQSVRHALFPLSDLEPGSMRSVAVGSVRVVVVRKRDGSLRALRDVCPHRGARLSNGKLARQVVGEAPGARRLTETEVVLCPWHGFEFDVDGGRCVADPDHVRVRSYPVSVEDGMIVVER
jgi:nitrite reductase/ring-hydroxylating ferredoxin subunit